MRISAFALALSTLPAIAGAADPACTAASGNALTPVVELYTSEGCDSCPPADRWFSGLKAEAARGKVVPLAFHVDYWDYLGWKDRFADPAFTARHREAASRGGAKVIYTPQVLFDGREFSQWRRTAAEKLADGKAPRTPRAELRIAATTVTADANQLQLKIAGRTVPGARAASAYVAIYENGLASDVKAGENKGVLLTHDYVVRRWLGPFAFDSAGTLSLAETIELPADAVRSHAGIAVLAVDDRGSLLQSLALPLQRCGS
ncbi:MAG: DUF1223 domain-containing protein [Betaproteobacteria bacterium]